MNPHEVREGPSYRFSACLQVHWANKDEIFLLQQTHADGESPRNTNLYDKVRKASVFVKANLDDDDDDDDNEDRDPQFDYEDATSDCDTDSQIDGSPRSPERTAVATFSIGLKQRNAQAQERSSCILSLKRWGEGSLQGMNQEASCETGDS